MNRSRAERCTERSAARGPEGADSSPTTFLQVALYSYLKVPSTFVDRMIIIIVILRIICSPRRDTIIQLLDS